MSKGTKRNYCPECGSPRIRKNKQGRYRKCLECKVNLSITTFNKRHREIEATPSIVISKGEQPGMSLGAAVTPMTDVNFKQEKIVDTFMDSTLGEPYNPYEALGESPPPFLPAL